MMKALCFWACKKQKLLQPLVAAEFTLAELQLAADQMREANEEKADAPSIKPKAFTATGWKVWKQSFKTYLSNFKGAHKDGVDIIDELEKSGTRRGSLSALWQLQLWQRQKLQGVRLVLERCPWEQR